MKLPPLLILLLLALTGCNRGAPEDKAAIKQAVVEHLSKNSGLDLSQMDIDVTSVSFKDKDATATVAFKPKGGADAGMSMNYQLESKSGKWAVVKRADSGGGHGGGMGAPGATGGTGAMGMPGGSPHGSTAPTGDLPPGHPPVSGKGGEKAGQTK